MPHTDRGIPNSACHEKIPESDMVEYRFDCAGYRVGFECHPRPPGTYRIVIVGSSNGDGQNVPSRRLFSTLLPQELVTPKRPKDRSLQITPWRLAFPRNVALRFDMFGSKARFDLVGLDGARRKART